MIMTLLVLNKKQTLSWLKKQMDKSHSVWDRFTIIKAGSIYKCNNCGQHVEFKSFFSLIYHECNEQI